MGNKMEEMTNMTKVMMYWKEMAYLKFKGTCNEYMIIEQTRLCFFDYIHMTVQYSNTLPKNVNWCVSLVILLFILYA